MENLSSVELSKGVFYVFNEHGEGLIYSPLQGKFFSADGDSQSIVNDFISSGKPSQHEFYTILSDSELLAGKREPEKPEKTIYRPTALMLSLSNQCNLRCVYCYANAGNSSKILSWNLITKSIDTMFTNAIETNKENIEVCFHGTGETLVRWETFRKTVNYVLSKKPEAIRVDFSLVTNGTLLDDERIKFLVANNFIITLSMDGTQPVQDKQRPSADGKGSYDDVIKGMKLLVDAKIDFIVRSTITSENIDLMSEFVILCAGLGCPEISFLPFSAVGRGATDLSQVTPHSFIENYLLAKKKGRELGITVSMVGTNISEISSYYCDAVGYNCVISPEGDISACSRVTSADDSLASVFIIGNVTESGLIVNQEKINSLANFNLYSYPECNDCFAKYVCSGGCPHDRLSFENKMSSTWCEIVKNLVWHEVRELAISQ